MGNQSSSTTTSSSSSSSSSSPHIDIDRIRPFSRNVGALGLSRNELDKRCQPSGLYGTCKWEDKAIRRLIADGRIAARQKGEETPDSASGATNECPICFLMYSDINTTKCCHASMCTECFLQVRPQKEEQSTCPFCNCDDFSVVLSAKKPILSDVDVPGMCPCETSSDSSGSSGSPTSSTANLNAAHTNAAHTNAANHSKNKTSTASVAPLTPKTSTGFGSELEKDERFKRMRKRSESFASSEGTSTPKKEQELKNIQSIAMTADERQRLEEEMKAQHYHPLVLRLEAEAQERRLENDRAYQSSSTNNINNNINNNNGNGNGNGNARNNSNRQQATSDTTSRGYHLSRRARAARNWDQIASFFDQGTEDIGAMTALETAILYSRFTEGEQQGDESSDGTGNSNSNTGGNSGGNSNSTNREQLEGIPLLRTLLTGQLDGMQDAPSSSSRSLNHMRSSSRRSRNQFLRSSMGSLRNSSSSSSSSSNRDRDRRGSGMNDVALETASMMMRGISEEEQIAMAIAASMQDQQGTDSSGAADSSDGTADDETNTNSEADEDNNETGSGSDSSSDSSNSETNRNAGDSSNSNCDGSDTTNDVSVSVPETASSSSPPPVPEASTITELARVVTDSSSPDITDTNTNTIRNGVTA